MDGSDLMTPILELKNIDYSYHTLDGETKERGSSLLS